ncbi:AAA family ATPase [Streptacidiphilus sp. PAMC 29251]
MLLVGVRVTKYKSIEDSSPVEIDPSTTVLVGINEAGKSAFLESLNKARPVIPGKKFNHTYDYPRKDLISYQRKHGNSPAEVVKLTYRLSEEEIAEINEDLDFSLLESLEFSLNYHYKNSFTVTLSIPEGEFVASLISGSTLPGEVKSKMNSILTVKDLISALDGEDLNEEGSEFLQGVKDRFGNDAKWHSLLSLYVWNTYVRPLIPNFLYFSDYHILPGKINLPSLAAAVQSGVVLTEEQQGAMSLFKMADIDMDELSNPESYEDIKAQLEAISNLVTDKVFQYWQQNPELDVEFDIRSDSNDAAPFNSGSNLYVRVKNRRHRVTVPFEQRSKGFIWSFSFIVWFSSVQELIGNSKELIILLDEPGLSLHGLAQEDFLRYIRDLSEKHQVIYTTHSPFMVDGEKLHQVRTVEDRDGKGTVVSGNLTSSDPRTVFPLQAALGYTIAQNLFIAKKNVLIEGPADLVYLRFFSSLLEMEGRTHLRDDAVLVPVGGLDKLATFVALLQGNQLQMVVVHDFAGKSEPRLESLIRDKIIKEKQVLHYAQVRDGKPQAILPATDVEDLISEDTYLAIFNAAYAKQLAGAIITSADLPRGDRIVQRIERYLKSQQTKLRPTGGYNHYLPATYLASNPEIIGTADADTLDRFERLFESINKSL